MTATESTRHRESEARRAAEARAISAEEAVRSEILSGLDAVGGSGGAAVVAAARAIADLPFEEMLCEAAVLHKRAALSELEAAERELRAAISVGSGVAARVVRLRASAEAVSPVVAGPSEALALVRGLRALRADAHEAMSVFQIYEVSSAGMRLLAAMKLEGVAAVSADARRLADEAQQQIDLVSGALPTGLSASLAAELQDALDLQRRAAVSKLTAAAREATVEDAKQDLALLIELAQARTDVSGLREVLARARFLCSLCVETAALRVATPSAAAAAAAGGASNAGGCSESLR